MAHTTDSNMNTVKHWAVG